ncbi:hypothetical protein TNCV_1507171 [Trichonephila clavipes]|nr:hypothetical protein TNCV_1507171 [Trichonephila clavipes]
MDQYFSRNSISLPICMGKRNRIGSSARFHENHTGLPRSDLLSYSENRPLLLPIHQISLEKQNFQKERKRRSVGNSIVERFRMSPEEGWTPPVDRLVPDFLPEQACRTDTEVQC